MNILTIIILIFLFILLFTFLIRTKIVKLMSLGLRFGFFTLILAVLSALFIPSLYSAIADLSLRSIGTYESIKSFDENFALNTVTESAENVLEDIEEFFTGEETVEEPESDKGFFEENLYPVLVSGLTILYRFLTIVLSLAGLIAIVYLSYAASGMTDTQKLKDEVKKLESRIIQLEGRFSGPVPNP